MAAGNDAVCSPSLTDANTATKRQRLITSTGTLTSPSSLHAPLPTLPFDLIPEILSRLPVKLLLQLKSVCKSWKSLISDPKFAKKHLRMSTACHHHHHLIVSSMNTKYEFFLWDSTISSIFSNVSLTSIVPQLQLMCPEALRYLSVLVSSCDGILLFDVDSRPPLVWNPSIRKFKILPPLLNPSRGRLDSRTFTFGYDHFIDNYKFFVVSKCIYGSEPQYINEVSVYTLGYDSWRRIDDIPCDGLIFKAGIFVSGTVNWLALHSSGSSYPVLVSLDLEKESYRKLLTPDLKSSLWTLGVLRDWLCIFSEGTEFLDVWVMKEYGIKESWTKLFSVPCVGSSSGYGIFYPTRVVYVSEDDIVLLDGKERKLVAYNSRNGNFKIPKFLNINCWMVRKVYVESLISPCS